MYEVAIYAYKIIFEGLANNNFGRCRWIVSGRLLAVFLRTAFIATICTSKISIYTLVTCVALHTLICNLQILAV